MPACIRITSGDDAGRVIEVAGELVLGRTQEGPGRIPDIEISRTHARLYVEADGGLAIEDLGSTNGTFVRGERITAPRPLSPGDTLRVGQTTLEVEATPAEEHSAPAPPADAAEPPAAPPPPILDPPIAPVPGAVHPHGPPVGAPVGPSDGATAGAPVGPPAGTAPGPPGTGAPSGGRGRIPRPLVGVLVGVLVLAALGIAAVLLLTGDDDEPQEERTRTELRVEGPPALQEAARAAGCTAQINPVEGRQHVRGIVDYKTNPPTSGNHDPQAAADGAYETAPPTAQLVHSLEHGRIVMWHKPDDREARELLRKVGDEDGDKMILVPNTTGMPFAVAATAWGHLLGCPRVNDQVPDAVRAFRDAYRGKGPEFVP